MVLISAHVRLRAHLLRFQVIIKSFLLAHILVSKNTLKMKIISTVFCCCCYCSINNDGDEDNCDDADEFGAVTSVAAVIEVTFASKIRVLSKSDGQIYMK